MTHKDYRYETEHFLLRQVQEEDAPALLKCYSNPDAVALMNDDNCTGGFLFHTVEEMREAIYYWNHDVFEYARPAVIDKATAEPIGTLEIFGAENGGAGVLRVDLRSDYERADVLAELYRLAVDRFFADFPMGAMVTKAPPAAVVRRKVLEELGFFGPEEFREYDSYYRMPAQKYRRELGIAYCGLACCLCSESAECPGCQNGGCPGHESCLNYNCARDRDVSGCWECSDFPCGRGIHKTSPRTLSFAKFAKKHGTEHLLDCLERNHREGVIYHCPGGLTGDYDRLTKQEIFRLLENGR